MIASVAHQAAASDERAILVDCRHRVLKRQHGKLLASSIEERIGADHERARPQLDQGCKDRIEIAIGTRKQDMEL